MWSCYFRCCTMNEIPERTSPCPADVRGAVWPIKLSQRAVPASTSTSLAGVSARLQWSGLSLCGIQVVSFGCSLTAAKVSLAPGQMQDANPGHPGPCS